MFIALDLETTGVSSDRDKIIEAAAVKFNGTKIIDTFDTLVNPGIPIPDIASQITGIKDADVASAPTFDQVRDDLATFIGDAPIVGHFIQFDTDFLKQNDIPLTNPEYDTFQLAGILLRGLPSYSLETISQLFDLDHHNKHRALDDSIAAIHLFNLLLSLINQIPESDRNQIASILEKSSWMMKELFTKTHDNIPEFNSPLPPQKPADLPTSPLNSTEQEILKNLTNSTNLLCETEPHTFVSKPATEWSQSHNTPILIAKPHSKKPTPLPPNATQIHPPQEYLSREKLQQFLQKPTFTDAETTLLLKSILWLPNTKTGHSSEIKIHGEERQAWFDICCSSPKEIPAEDGFFQDALTQAVSKNLIFTDHKLLCHYISEDETLLPQTTHLIIDQAHAFEKNATHSQTIFFKFKTIETLLQKLSTKIPEAESILDQFMLFMGLTGLFFNKFAAHQDYEKRVIISNEFENTPEWKKSLESAKNTIEIAKNFISKINLKDKPTLYLAIPFINQIKNLIKIVNNFNSHTNLTWIFNDEDYFGLQSTPLDPLSTITPKIESTFESIIITSPNITINKNFNFISSQLSLSTQPAPSFNQFTPQITRPNLNLSIPPEIVSTNNKNYQDSCTEFIRGHLLNTNQNTFIIMSSRKAIEQTYEALSLKAKDNGKHLFAQNLTGSQGKILEKFKQEPHDTTIIGTKYFWQFTELPEVPIENLIIQKIPFEPIRDPWIEARGEQYSNSFTEFLLPRAIIEFKSIINKFLSLPGQTKNIHILDTRITNSNYGDTFLEEFKSN